MEKQATYSNNSRKRVWIQTFGCQMNENDTEKMYRILKRLDYEPTPGPENADLILLNTCSIREKPEQKVFSSLGRLKRFKDERPDVKIGVAGCMAQLMGDKIIKRAPYVDLVLGTYSIQKLPMMLRAEENHVVEASELNKDDFDFLPLHEGDLSTAASPDTVVQRTVSRHVTIQNGCNKNCSYCIVPTTRGREISRDADEVLQEVRLQVEHGAKEIVLVGQTVNSYGLMTDCDFSDLLRRINKVDGLERIRFVTSHPRDLNEKLMAAMAECDKVCDHLHLPLQSGSNRVLKRMYRGHTLEKYLDRIEMLRKYVPDIALSTDMIVAFPGETEDDFQETLKAVEAVRFDSMFSFIFSPRPFTVAENLPDQIPLDVAKDRLQRLQARQNEISAELLACYLNQTVEVLVEGASANVFEQGHLSTRQRALKGRTTKNVSVFFDGPARLKGHTIPVKIDRVLHHSLQGIPVAAEI